MPFTLFHTFCLQFPAYCDFLPHYAQSEVYQKGLGPNSLPSEFYLIPTDHYIPLWFGLNDFDTGLPTNAYANAVAKAKFNLPIWDVLYKEAAKFFN